LRPGKLLRRIEGTLGSATGTLYLRVCAASLPPPPNFFAAARVCETWIRRSFAKKKACCSARYAGSPRDAFRVPPNCHCCRYLRRRRPGAPNGRAPRVWLAVRLRSRSGLNDLGGNVRIFFVFHASTERIILQKTYSNRLHLVTVQPDIS
jgi:hypothetical protein